MEVVAVSALLNILVPKLLDVYSRKQELRKKGLDEEIRRIKDNLDAMGTRIQDNYKSGTCMNLEREGWIKRLHKLAQDTEDCIDFFLLQTARNSVSLEDFASNIEALETRSKKMAENTPWPSPGQLDAVPAGKEPPEPPDRSSEPVGMKEPIKRLLKLLGVQPVSTGKSPLAPVVQPAAKSESSLEPVAQASAKSDSTVVKPKVISILGFNGLGKTRLAKQVYNHNEVIKHFDVRAWVRAAGHGALEVLQDIRKKLENCASTSTDVQQADFPGIDGASSLSKLCEDIARCLKGKKYCIVIDDIRTTGLWELYLLMAFPNDADSRIIVTTTTQPVANVCAAMNGYVYKMPTLSTAMAEKLFFEDFEPPSSMNDSLTRLLKKCDGLPLALIGVLAYLKTLQNPISFEEETCKEVCRRFPTCLITNPTLATIRDVLVKKYNSLPFNGVRTCLLYFYLFPDHNHIREGSRTRQCLAEGFFKEKSLDSLQIVIANDYLETLVGHSIIQPIQVSNMGFPKHRVKKCRPHGIMLEYMSFKSISENFITLLCGPNETPQEVELENVRRLSLHHGAADNEDFWKKFDFPLIRTLAVSGEACKAIMDFSRYELLRVLDLQKCGYQLSKEQLEVISIKLLLLKYLSLGNVTLKNNTLPSSIGRLLLLETLEMKKNKEPVGLSEDVIKLPKLKHIIGKFWFAGTPEKSLEDFLSEKSLLETFSGFVTGKSRGFARLMSHMKRLWKVKIWYDSNANPDNLNDLSEAISGFTDLQSKEMSRSLSIELAVYSEVVLKWLQDIGRVTSVVRLKLSGNLRQFLPATPEKRFTGLGSIKELCLSKTKLSAESILSALGNLKALKDLTLAEEDLEQVALKPGTFKGLERICLVSKITLQIKIEGNALPHLVSLHMICEALGGPAGIEITGLASLQEIALHAQVHPGIIKEWKKAAKGHGMRPNVLLIVSKFRFDDQDTSVEIVPSGPSAVPADIVPPGTSAVPVDTVLLGASAILVGKDSAGTSAVPVDTVPPGASDVPVDTFPPGASAVPVDTVPPGASAVPVKIGKRSTSKKLRSSIAKIMKSFICGHRGSGTIE